MKDETKTNIDANNVIVIDADYLEEVTDVLKGGFEKQLGRAFQKSDLTEWIDCVALDGGLTPGDNKSAVILFHDNNKKELFHYVPSNYNDELNDKAFKDNLGEFVFTSIPVVNRTMFGEMITETLSVFGAEKSVNRITLVANVEKYHKNIDTGLSDLKKKSKDKNEEVHFTAVTMHQKADWTENQVILGFSIIHTLGITDEDLKNL